MMNETDPRWCWAIAAPSLWSRTSSWSPTMRIWPTRWASVIESNTDSVQDTEGGGATVGEPIGGGDEEGAGGLEVGTVGPPNGVPLLHAASSIAASRLAAARRPRVIGWPVVVQPPRR